MKQIVGWVLGVLLCFLCCIVAPVILVSVTDELSARRQIDNEIIMFVDSVRDSSVITDSMLEDFYLAVNSYGMTMDVTILKYSKVVNPVPDGAPGSTYTSYVASEDYRTYQQGDLIKVSAKPIGYTAGQRTLMSFLRYALPDYKPTYTGRIR